jgi:hypothetical protein
MIMQRAILTNTDSFTKKNYFIGPLWLFIATSFMQRLYSVKALGVTRHIMVQTAGLDSVRNAIDITSRHSTHPLPPSVFI